MTEPKTILIVDDEIDMRLFLSTLVETSGYRRVLARNGEEGLKAAKEHRPDLIFLDIMMPKEGGVYMYGQLRTTPELKDIPVIILSAISRKTFYHYLKMLSVRVGDLIPEPDAYVEKPPEADDILALIKKLTG
ncbi:MAG: response regulator [Pseudomonadota bacterium]